MAQLIPAAIKTRGDSAAAIAPLRPLLRRARKGRYLAVLLEDRLGEQ
ncbi:MAG: hypothetical protein Q7R30_21970 [Acidobacteriota bacterium]|nr:hypothetical protein [Acidobacteriota bacterium]